MFIENFVEFLLNVECFSVFLFQSVAVVTALSNITAVADTETKYIRIEYTVFHILFMLCTRLYMLCTPTLVITFPHGVASPHRNVIFSSVFGIFFFLWSVGKSLFLNDELIE